MLQNVSILGKTMVYLEIKVSEFLLHVLRHSIWAAVARLKCFPFSLAKLFQGRQLIIWEQHAPHSRPMRARTRRKIRGFVAYPDGGCKHLREALLPSRLAQETGP